MWQCVKCREELEDSFDACWRCGTLKDSLPVAIEKNPYVDFEPGMSDESLIASNKQQPSVSAITQRHVPDRGNRAAGVSPSLVGAMVGGVVGAVVRPTAVFLAIGEPLPEVYIGSSVIGLFVGALSGLTLRPLAGAVLGSVLAVVLYRFSIIPLALFMCLAGRQSGQHPPSWWLIALTGAISGGIGGFAGLNTSRKRTDSQSGPR